jgi:hypothetical protein
VKAHGAAVAVEDVESARHKLLESGQRRVREDARDAWITPLLERANENEVFRCDEQLSVSHRHVLALTLADVSIEHLGAAARARLACDVSTDFDICGSVPCARHSVMWMSDLEARVNLFNVRVRACCSVCGFRAIASPGVKTIQLQSEGTTWLEAASELHRERILTDNEQAMHLGVTPRELERRWTAAYWRSREAHKHRVPYRVFAFTATQHDWRLLPTRT